MPERKRVAVLADSDTRWKWGATTARRLVPDHQLTGYLLRGRATPTARQLGEVGVGAARPAEVTCAEFLAEIGRERYDVVVLALVGGAVQAVLHGARALWPAPARRPVLVTGYVGVVYEKLADGLLLRHGADLVLANSRHDAERFRAVYEGVGADAGAVTETALPFLGGAPYEPAGSRAHTVVFAVQPSVPDSRADRAYLLERAVGHARKHPAREVLIKLRSKPGEHTTHLEEQPYQRLAERVRGGLPANCRLVYGNMGEVLDGADLLVTVSSTAALEALHRSIPTAVLTDLGIREALGNHHFLGSGCLASWDQLDAGLLPEGDPVWLAAHGVRPAAVGPDAWAALPAPGHAARATGATSPGPAAFHGSAAGPPAPPAATPVSAVPAGTPASAVPASAVPTTGEDVAAHGASVHDAHDPYALARAKVAGLLAAARLPAPAPYYTLTTAPGYLPGILARHRLAPDGTPQPGAARPEAGQSRLRRRLRTHLREAARGVYRHGVQRVAPVIRRLGEL
ncbi:DUF6716 putative glycosyltransferase [Streptomyces yangpuensis]|uniref:DUF6716 putative glycosyltransferase n=1 Tax=Streptomyces yangpuensis TaxID=1648182 RepID=UPI000629135F|nr:DUF6716 putative glycosyltransferase [Streptomyces yangpuensis]